LSDEECRARRDGDADKPVGCRFEFDEADAEQQWRYDDGADHGQRKAGKHDAPGKVRTIAAIGEVGHQKRKGIGEGAPGQDVGQRQAADLPLHRELDEDIRCHDDKRHGDHEGQVIPIVHFFILGDGTSGTIGVPVKSRSLL
jgi:hypothetical protein